MSAPALLLLDVADALDAFPALSDSDRAHIFHAIDTAPALYRMGTYDPAEPYALAWDHAKEIQLTAPGASVYPLTLWEASGFSSVPTRGEILSALDRAARLIQNA